jgi:hypothetical protein
MNEFKHSPLPEDEDRRMEMLFRAAAEPVADDGFSVTVMRRVARRAWRRRLVLTTAGAAGLAVAWQPVWTIAVLLGQSLAQLGGRWPELAWVLQSPLAMAAGLLVIGAPGFFRWLEE